MDIHGPVIPIEDRKVYIEALEKVSVSEDTVPIRDFLCGLVKKELAGAALPAVPTKVSALEDLLEPLLEEGHKVLVFSQFVTIFSADDCGQRRCDARFQFARAALVSRAEIVGVELL